MGSATGLARIPRDKCLVFVPLFMEQQMLEQKSEGTSMLAMPT